ncbi:Protein phosphatase 2C [Spironucleus salmonicida]|uniref:Protein phosphatase 2C n=1 Tax=Spironucleus salmonicida TaxID=348837 RepID=V6LXY1_9EUKA|nr:Protein phosphatase 2C [Spironucleus salmonicida]|eukprot:EST49502.1 Protein phosphatase 2C [Spironucleus salmonicida]
MNPFKVGQFSQQFSANQDHFYVNQNYPVFASVFDGHGQSDNAALFLKQKLYNKIKQDLAVKNTATIAAKIKQLDDEFNSTTTDMSGSTIASIYIDQNSAIAFNLGDSRIYYQRNGNFNLITNDHSVENDKQKLIQKGGIVKNNLLYVSPWVFANSRSFGDKVAKKYLDNSAEFYESPPTFEFALIVSDGIWSVLEDKEMQQIANRNLNNPYIACRELVRQAARAQLRLVDAQDDCTAVLIVRCKIFDEQKWQTKFHLSCQVFIQKVQEFEEEIQDKGRAFIRSSHKSARELRTGVKKGNLHEIVRNEKFSIEEFVLSFSDLQVDDIIEAEDDIMGLLQ